MSVQAISWAYEAAGEDANEAFVLVTLSNYADAYGVLWPSKTKLHRDCRCSLRKLQYTLKDLEERGLILRIPRRRDNGSRRADGIVLVGFPGRVVPESRDDHDLFSDLPAEFWDRIAADQPAPGAACAAESDENALTNVHPVHGAAQDVGVENLGDANNVHPVHGGGVHPVHGAPQDVGVENLGDANNVHPVHGGGAPGAPLEPSLDPLLPTTISASRSVDEIEASCFDASGPGLCDQSREAIVESVDVIREWIDEGFDLDADILPAIRDRTARERSTPIRTWAYFTEAIRATRRKRLAKRTSDPPVEGKEEKPASVTDRAQRIADWIKSGSYVPPSVVSNSLRDELLARGLVDAETLRRLQIY